MTCTLHDWKVLCVLYCIISNAESEQGGKNPATTSSSAVHHELVKDVQLTGDDLEWHDERLQKFQKNTETITRKKPQNWRYCFTLSDWMVCSFLARMAVRVDAIAPNFESDWMVQSSAWLQQCTVEVLAEKSEKAEKVENTIVAGLTQLNCKFVGVSFRGPSLTWDGLRCDSWVRWTHVGLDLNLPWCGRGPSLGLVWGLGEPWMGECGGLFPK